MPKFRTHDMDLVTGCLISKETRQAIDFQYVDETGAKIRARGVVISMSRVAPLSERTWDIVYLAEA